MGDTCKTCNGTGVEETGNNDFPCHCPLGKKALFSVSTATGLKQMTGEEVDAYNASWRSAPPSSEDKGEP